MSCGNHCYESEIATLEQENRQMRARMERLEVENLQLQKQVDFFEQASAASGGDYKFVTLIQVLDGGNGTVAPTVLEAWEIYGCYLQGVNYNDANYGTSEAMTVSMTIRYDNALQTPNGTGVGATVGRTVGDVATG